MGSLLLLFAVAVIVAVCCCCCCCCCCWSGQLPFTLTHIIFVLPLILPCWAWGSTMGSAAAVVVVGLVAWAGIGSKLSRTGRSLVFLVLVLADLWVFPRASWVRARLGRGPNPAPGPAGTDKILGGGKKKKERSTVLVHPCMQT